MTFLFFSNILFFFLFITLFTIAINASVHSVSASHVIPYIPKEFQANAYLHNNIHGVLSYSYNKKSVSLYRGLPYDSKYRDLFRFDKNIHYHLYSFFSKWSFNCTYTEYVRGDLYPLFIPSTAKFDGIVKESGIKTEKYSIQDWKNHLYNNIKLEWWTKPENTSLVRFQASSDIDHLLNNIDAHFYDMSTSQISPSTWEIPSGCPSPKCTQPNNFVLLLDGDRQSVSQTEWQTAKHFANEFLTTLDFEHNKSSKPSLGIVQFANSGKIEADLSQERSFLKAEINQMDQLSSLKRNTQDGLKTAATLFDSYRYHSNINSYRSNVLFLITTGRHDQGGDPAIEATKIKKEFGIEIFVIGVGNKIDQDELKDIASEPKPKHMFNVSDWNELLHLVPSLFKGSC
eukprot:gb/GECH01000228.1/.p1 GENE.gb/GECH01000228.1/~~gb/GECH01000228.1/.p1  ORF type:complete len:400 (+),score=86.32 gb/GECH01000228.1/:1-1200(+)